MKSIVLGLCCFTAVVIAEISVEVNYDPGHEEIQAKFYDIHRSTELKCKVKATADEKYTIKWKKGDDDFQIDKERMSESKGTDYYNIVIEKANEKDGVTYSCVIKDKSTDDEITRANITLLNRYRIKNSDGSINVIEGEKLKVECIVVGRPAPEIYWIVGNMTYYSSEGRVTLSDSNDYKNSMLTIDEATMDDRGNYTCVVTPTYAAQVQATMFVRIKDKYAALWPFLGICAEVFVLCAIILIYEKKRNKTEMEESDTDQSPDQKNTPDHGKDSSNLRHRN